MMPVNKNMALNTADFVGDAIGPSDLTRAQWALIERLQCEHVGKPVFGTDCLFEDDRWFDGDGLSDEGVIIWGRTFIEEDSALHTLTRVVFFEWIRSRGMTISTMVSKLWLVKKYLIKLVRNKGLLSGKKGESLIGLGHLSDEDFLAIIDMMLINAPTEDAAVSAMLDLATFLEFMSGIADAAPIYELNATLPWQKSGMSVREWATRRANDLELTFTGSVGFEPLPPECTQPIIERSLSIIQNYSDHLVSISWVLKHYDKTGTKRSKLAVDTLEKYSSIFGDLLPPPSTDSLQKAYLVNAVTRWLRELLYLARGACVNVILLTTGLRNIDIRRLKVGCCTKSGRIDMLFYLKAQIKKTQNTVHLPVPGQTNEAVCFLEQIKHTDSSYLLDGELYAAFRKKRLAGNEARLTGGVALNKMVRHFAAHFGIPFLREETDTEHTLHCYRTTVAGWLGAASNLSVLMVRRLFGHSNDVMPTVYLRNNPAFIAERKGEKERAATETARQMALAASEGRLAGNKGILLERGYQRHVSLYEKDKAKSHSLTDAELVLGFSDLIKQRILNETLCGFMTPFGVRCMRNPTDTAQPPCAKRSHREKVKDADKTLLDLISDIDPQNCIGTSCSEAMVGPWSESIKGSLLWYAGLLRHQHDDDFHDEHFRQHAEQFIRQYGPAIRKVFGVKVMPGGNVTSGGEHDHVERKANP